MRVLHFMVYDGPGGYCRVIYELCKRSVRSTPSVGVLGEGEWTKRLRTLGIQVGSFRDVIAAPDLASSYAKLQALVGDIDLVNVHIGPAYTHEVEALVSLFEMPVVFTLHWAWRLPVTRRPIICTSRTLPRLQRPSNRCYVIENGVDIATYKPARSAREPVIIRVCRPERSAHYFWDAVMPVLARHREAKLWIVGESGTSTHPRVEYLGVRDDVPALLRRAQIFAYAPRPNEGSHDLVVLEAMASGTVPVAPAVDATAMITHGRDGLRVPYGDVLAFERTLDRALADPQRLRRLAGNARATVVRRFDIRHVAARYEQVYAEILG
jgi:glycosyltransferase involved in cell wall biosynthesis